MMRPAAAILLALLAATALPAAKPVPPDNAPAQLIGEAWRSQGVPVCVARLRTIRAFTPDDLETICGCTFDSYLEGHGTEPLPGIENDRIPVAVEHQLLSCTTQTRPERVSDVARLSLTAPPTLPPVAEAPRADDPKPLDDDNVPADTESGGNDGGFWDWVSAITLPAWLTGASMLWWIALGIFVFGLLILKVRRRDPRNDLMGPPSSMRRGAPPRPPRRPDLPR